MREIRTYGSEGGEARAFPTPIAVARCARPAPQRGADAFPRSAREREDPTWFPRAAWEPSRGALRPACTAGRCRCIFLRYAAPGGRANPPSGSMLLLPVANRRG